MGRSKPRIFIAIMASLALFLTPILTGFSYAYNQDNSNYQGCVLCEASKDTQTSNEKCKTCLDQETVKKIKEHYGISAEEIKGSKASKYVNMINNFKGTKNKLKIEDKAKVVIVKPENIIQVVGLHKMNKNKKKTLIYGYIDGNTEEIISVVSFKWKDLKNSDKATINVYKQNGLKKSKTYSIEEIKAKNEQIKQYIHKKIKISQEKLASAFYATEYVYQVAWDWEQFACSFSGLLACTAGCVVFVPPSPLFQACEMACNLAWSAGVCSEL